MPLRLGVSRSALQQRCERVEFLYNGLSRPGYSRG